MSNSKSQRDALPSNSMERNASLAIRPLGALLVLLLLAYGWAVYAAPIDRVQGVIQKILYVHPPMAYGAYLGFVVTGIAGGLYLWRRPDADVF